VTEAAHSKLSASAADRWMACPGSVVLSEGQPDNTSEYAAWGSVAHRVADECLTKSKDPVTFIGLKYNQDGYTFTVDEDMVECVQTYLRNLREMTAGADLFESETRTNYAAWLQVDESLAWGTADATALIGTELQVHDLKTGRGVEVDAMHNQQMMLYAGGKLLEMEALGIDIETVRLVIHQPRVRQAPSEWGLTRQELATWLTSTARSGAASVLVAQETRGTSKWDETFLRSGDQCRWCRAKATCPALRADVAQTTCKFDFAPATPEDFADLTPNPAASGASEHWLAACLSKVDLIEDWCSAIRAESLRRLSAGAPVPGYKLVQGKRGNRQWADPAEAEKVLREQFRLPVEKAYDLKLISPTTAEKLAKAGEIGPRQWAKVIPLIVQRDGAPSVAPVSDNRPAITVQPVVEAFEVQAGDLV
jgi:hypothetical protein